MLYGNLKFIHIFIYTKSLDNHLIVIQEIEIIVNKNGNLNNIFRKIKQSIHNLATIKSN